MKAAITIIIICEIIKLFQNNILLGVLVDIEDSIEGVKNDTKRIRQADRQKSSGNN